MILLYLGLAIIGFVMGKWVGALFLPAALFYLKNQTAINEWLKTTFNTKTADTEQLVRLLGYVDSLSAKASTASTKASAPQETLLKQLKQVFPDLSSATLTSWFSNGRSLSPQQAEALVSVIKSQTNGQPSLRHLAIELAYLTVVMGAGYTVKNRAFITYLLSQLSVSTDFLKQLESRFTETPIAEDKAVSDVAIEKAYAELGLSSNASIEAVKQARKRLLNTYHPDKLAVGSDGERQVANSRVDQINKAYKKIQQYRGFV